MSYSKYIFSLAVLCLAGFYLLIDDSGLLAQIGVPKETIFTVIHVPSLLFILCSWFIAELFLDSNKPERKSGFDKIYTQLKKDNSTFAEVTGLLMSENLSSKNKGYSKVHKEESPLVKAFVMHKNQGLLKDDFEFEISKVTRDAMHEIEERIQHANFVSSVLPMLGMVGTLIGLMLMAVDFQNQGVTDFDEKKSMGANFEALGIALLTTLYASLITVSLIKPRVQAYKNKLAKFNNQCEEAWQNCMYLYEVTEGYFLSVESEQERQALLNDAYPHLNPQGRKDA